MTDTNKSQIVVSDANAKSPLQAFIDQYVSLAKEKIFKAKKEDTPPALHFPRDKAVGWVTFEKNGIMTRGDILAQGDIEFTHEEKAIFNLSEEVTDFGFLNWIDEDVIIGIDAKWTNLKDQGIENLSRLVALESLNLGGTGVTGAGLNAIANLKSLKNLVLENTSIDDSGLAVLANLGNLETLNLANTKVTDAGLESLKALTKLKSLNLMGTKITDAGLESLKTLTQLEALSLDGTKVTVAGIQTLTVLSQINFLALDGTKLGDDVVVELAKFPRLKTLWANRTKLTASGKALLKEALPKGAKILVG